MPKLVSHSICTGCGACNNSCTRNAIKMVNDAEGFLYPEIDASKCIECGCCEKVCPLTNEVTNNNETTPQSYAFWSDSDRIHSSSGGAFSAFARIVLNNGGMVYGAAYDENLKLRHIGISSIDDLRQLRGSKYVQSEIGNIYNEIKQLLRTGKEVLFCGTPCQVAGLKSFLKNKEYNGLLTLDLVCHGVPSNSIFQNYLAKLRNTKYKNLDGFEFRRRNGWGFAPSVSIEGKLHPIYGTDNLYMCAFEKSALFRNCCYECKFATFPRQGDCTIADFWGIGRHGIPFRHNVMKGVSLILINNEKGRKYLQSTKNCFIEERSLEEALIENWNIKHPSIKPQQREAIISAFLDRNQTLNTIDKKFHLVDKSLKGIIKSYASKWKVFDIVKWIYNKYKAL